MKREVINLIIGFVCGISGLIFVLYEHSKSDEALTIQNKRLHLEIDKLHVLQAKKEKHIQYLMEQYTKAKDSLDAERVNIKVRYVHYKEPVKVDLSTDVKRDSVINRLIR